ncbi:hypothetical protein WMF04_50185 [Sorangium sp. So ce260]|uniref:hypothetical protein n=1 Tax=Sorangium sp. So ce260 TaxID=3133291 RepID=UPI003F5E5EC7
MSRQRRHRIGKLAEEASPEGHRTTYRYAALGRPRETELAIEGERFATTADYDMYSRPFRLWYPRADGERRFGVRRIFDAHGHLVGVRNARSREMFWQFEDTDEAGRIRAEAFGNGLRLLDVGATRPICPACAALIESAGAQPVTPLKVP